MYSLINEYQQSCLLVKKRIKFLTEQRNRLIKSDNRIEIDKAGLDQRIRLLYVEHAQMQEIISHLINYMRRIEHRAET
ncbi:MAG: hypothetical protein K2I80_05210 [Ruminococcus sp.]|nr:hypothetical protein [Ruminococcus sp.]MDE6849258.1 hypothetical protein [Ruminococcus sp.]